MICLIWGLSQFLQRPGQECILTQAFRDDGRDLPVPAIISCHPTCTFATYRYNGDAADVGMTGFDGGGSRKAAGRGA